MDIELLSKMVGELVLDHDEVGLPGLGTFMAEIVPASFSDRGYTINPPYRRLVFRSTESDDNSLVEFYAKTNSVEMDAAKNIVGKFLSGLAAQLRDEKMIELPGLGRLRATKNNNFFFVCDEELSIFPEGFGLKPLSLKNRVAVSAVPAMTPAPEPEMSGSAMSDSASATSEPSDAEPAPESDASDAAAPESAAKPAPKRRRRFLYTIIWLLAIFIVAMILFRRTAMMFPDFVDSILYTPEELELLNN